MKRTRVKLISLLGLCSDNKKEATRLQLLTSITQSEDYSSLSKSIALKQPFEELYGLEKLEKLNNSELTERESLLHDLVSFEAKLIKSINSGNGPKMTNEDAPDFASSKSIAKTCSKICLSKNKTNYTNLSEDNILAVFSDTTIKSAAQCIDKLPVSITQNCDIDEEIIKNHMGNLLFCIDIEDFQTHYEECLNLISKCEALIEKEKFRRKKHLLFKISIVMLCFGLVFSCSQFGLFSESYTPLFTLFMVVISILFLTWG